jgi:citrate lyase subunit beta/citryl-CoA lyase
LHGVRTLPRSFLYVPATKPELFAKAARGPADAVVLDLEDTVPVAEKEPARARVREWLAAGGEHVAQQWVRVNAESLEQDLEAVVQPALHGLFLAKCGVRELEIVGDLLPRLEQERRVREVAVVGLVETAQGLVDLPAITRSPRLTTLGVGEVDLLADLRVTRSERSAAAVDRLRTDVVVHCAAAGRAAPVAPTSTAFRDLDAFAETTRHLHDLGFRSRTAIHPAQIAVIHDVLTPTEAEVAAARDVVARFDAAAGGVTTDEQGRLIDAAVVRQARETLQRSGQQE